MTNLADRITVDPDQCGGRPCVRGMRIRVSDVLDLLANDLSPEQVIEEFPDLESEDIELLIENHSTMPVMAVFTELQQVVLNFVVNAEQVILGSGRLPGRITIHIAQHHHDDFIIRKVCELRVESFDAAAMFYSPKAAGAHT